MMYIEEMYQFVEFLITDSLPDLAKIKLPGRGHSLNEDILNVISIYFIFLCSSRDGENEVVET
jgi:hypothetical protein